MNFHDNDQRDRDVDPYYLRSSHPGNRHTPRREPADVGADVIKLVHAYTAGKPTVRQMLFNSVGCGWLHQKMGEGSVFSDHELNVMRKVMEFAPGYLEGTADMFGHPLDKKNPVKIHPLFVSGDTKAAKELQAVLKIRRGTSVPEEALVKLARRGFLDSGKDVDPVTEAKAILSGEKPLAYLCLKQVLETMKADGYKVPTLYDVIGVMAPLAQPAVLQKPAPIKAPYVPAIAKNPAPASQPAPISAPAVAPSPPAMTVVSGAFAPLAKLLEPQAPSEEPPMPTMADTPATQTATAAPVSMDASLAKLMTYVNDPKNRHQVAEQIRVALEVSRRLEQHLGQHLLEAKTLPNSSWFKDLMDGKQAWTSKQMTLIAAYFELDADELLACLQDKTSTHKESTSKDTPQKDDLPRLLAIANKLRGEFGDKLRLLAEKRDISVMKAGEAIFKPLGKSATNIYSLIKGVSLWKPEHMRSLLTYMKLTASELLAALDLTDMKVDITVATPAPTTAAKVVETKAPAEMTVADHIATFSQQDAAARKLMAAHARAIVEALGYSQSQTARELAKNPANGQASSLGHLFRDTSINPWRPTMVQDFLAFTNVSGDLLLTRLKEHKEPACWKVDVAVGTIAAPVKEPVAKAQAPAPLASPPVVTPAAEVVQDTASAPEEAPEETLVEAVAETAVTEPETDVAAPAVMTEAAAREVEKPAETEPETASAAAAPGKLQEPSVVSIETSLEHLVQMLLVENQSLSAEVRRQRLVKAQMALLGM